MQFIRGLPGSGKSTLARLRPDRYVDSDVVAEVMDAKSAAAFVAKSQSSSWRLEFHERLREHAGTRVVLSNFEPTYYGAQEADVLGRFRYEPEDYVSHLMQAGRHDLLNNFSASELARWARDYTRFQKVMSLQVDEYLGDALSKF